MRHRVFAIALLALVSLLPACRSSTQAPAPFHRGPTTAAVIPLTAPKAGEVTVEQLELLLPRRPIVVGFDVDDTLIFSAPAFNALQPQYDPDVIRPKDYNALTPEQKAKYREFWNRLNGEYDDRSVPKKIGKRLLALHIARGDDIWIISKRQSIVPAPREDVVSYGKDKVHNGQLGEIVIADSER